ncbi:MAG: hypothetical protein PHZ25_03030 [Candidatus Pacebacteria bacterium]|nr:hypothetical protein [Candidatus Paceibacterota bacterium]
MLCSFLLTIASCFVGIVINLTALFFGENTKSDKEIHFFCFLLFFLIFIFSSFSFFSFLPAEDFIFRENKLPMDTFQKTILSIEVDGKWLVKLEDQNKKSNFYLLSEKPPELFQFIDGEFKTDFFSSSKIFSASTSISE